MTDELAFLIESRGAAALVYGLSVGALLRLLGLARIDGALVSAAAIAATFVPGGWPPAHLLALVLGMTGLAGRIARPGDAPRPGALDTTILAMGYVVAVWGSATQPLAGLWLAGAIAALGTGAGTWVARVVIAPAGGARYRLPSLRPRTDGHGIGADALIAAAAAPIAVAVTAFGLGMSGPGEPAPIALGAMAGLLVTRDARTRLLAVVATLLGGALGAGATHFLA